MSQRQSILLLLAIFAVLSSSLHFGIVPKHLQATTYVSSGNPELDALRSQQQNFELSVNNLVVNLTNVQAQMNGTSNNTQKVLILEKAIIRERNQVFKISNDIIPPFNLSVSACQQLTDSQKIGILNQINNTRVQIASLKNLATNIPACDQINSINADILKQETLLNSIQKIVYTNCTSSALLSPTIWQTNIYSNNWILGNQTIDDLIDQYYQRSSTYPNVTNCPQGFPFYNGQACIICSDPEKPIFNILTKQCVSCDNDSMINNNLRICVPAQHYTNYTNVTNWKLDGATGLPPINASLTPCLRPKPYYDGKVCTNCSRPKYWSVQDNVCKSCPQGQVFNPNTKNCVVPYGETLTLLGGTNWVTNDGNVTRVLDARNQYLANLTADQQPLYCDQSTPYFDGLSCISCPSQFNLDTKKCANPPVGLAFDQNLRKYVPPESNVQTDPAAHNYTSAQRLVDSATPNCNQTHPYYDGVACIYCQEPFTVFDNDQKRCSTCDPSAYFYNDTSHHCQPRTVLYISNRTDGLMASPNKTIPQYWSDVNQTYTQNPNAIFKPCPDPTMYSNYTNCVPCQSGQFFNVGTLMCVNCNGTLDPNTSLCKAPTTYLTNLSDPNLLAPGNKTINDYKTQQTDLSAVSPTVICTNGTPYTADGKTCVNCTAPTPLWDLDALTCTSCPQGQYYNPLTLKCSPPTLVTNTNATNYIEYNNDTMANVQANNTLLNASVPTTPCDISTPFKTSSGCINCTDPNIPYFNLSSQQCQNCSANSTYNPTSHTCQPNAVYYPNLTNQNWTVSNGSNPQYVTNMANALSKAPGAVPCPAGSEFYNNVTGQCVSCPPGLLYNYDTLQCSNCTAPNVFDTNTKQCGEITKGKYQTNLGRPNLVYGGIPFAQYQDQYNSNVTAFPNIQDCPPDKPFFDGSSCIICTAPKSYFNLRSKLCLACVAPSIYSPDDKECTQNGQPVTTDPNIAKMYSTIF